jgi:hypothetical protein
LAAGVKRRNSDALLVAGGPHASALPTQVAADGCLYPADPGAWGLR